MKNWIFIVVGASLLWAPGTLRASSFATEVIDYEPGEGFAKDWATGAGYTKTGSILGPPSSVTQGEFAGLVTPFSPPYLLDQILSIGKGGQVTVKFDRPIRNESLNPFGLDFIVFGAAGFTITNGDFTGGGITDGSLFGQAEGGTRVSVSNDGETWFVLNSELAPAIDGYYPTDGSGDADVPVNPALGVAEIAEAGLAKLKELYGGSAGGTGFDLDWAIDADGEPVSLGQAQFVRLEVLSGRAEIDALSDVRPKTAPLGWHYESFATNPLANGWMLHGDESLFEWDAEAGALDVTWNSEKPNSYFYRPLGQALTEKDSFAFTFQLTLDEVKAGHLDGQPYTFEVSIGLLNLENAKEEGFIRGTGTDSPNLVEWDYFPDTGFGATVSPALASSKSEFSAGFTFPAELTKGKVYTVRMEYDGSTGVLKSEMLEDGKPWKSIAEVKRKIAHSGFLIDAFSISNYTAKGSESSLFATGAIDELAIATSRSGPSLVDVHLDGGRWSARVFVVNPDDWQLQRSGDLLNWKSLDVVRQTSLFFMRFADPEPVGRNQFYRITR